MAQSKIQGAVDVGCSNVLGGVSETTVSIIASTKVLLQFEPCADSPTPKESDEAPLGLAAWWPRGGGKLQAPDKTLPQYRPVNAPIRVASR